MSRILLETVPNALMPSARTFLNSSALFIASSYAWWAAPNSSGSSRQFFRRRRHSPMWEIMPSTASRTTEPTIVISSGPASATSIHRESRSLLSCFSSSGVESSYAGVLRRASRSSRTCRKALYASRRGWCLSLAWSERTVIRTPSRCALPAVMEPMTPLIDPVTAPSTAAIPASIRGMILSRQASCPVRGKCEEPRTGHQEGSGYGATAGRTLQSNLMTRQPWVACCAGPVHRKPSRDGPKTATT